tara:strand:- start:95 stop:244 length:150 start_codon:yes stop_codon:yes gene_type:complete
LEFDILIQVAKIKNHYQKFGLFLMEEQIIKFIGNKKEYRKNIKVCEKIR